MPRAVHSRLHMFLDERAYEKVPEGREIVQTDESARLDELLPDQGDGGGGYGRGGGGGGGGYGRGGGAGGGYYRR